MVEDNSEEYVLYDENQVNDVCIIKSVLKKLIGKYSLFTETEENQIKTDLASVSILSIYLDFPPN
jgi:hypothetical protein